MIDPFFFERLMQAFTTTNATPLGLSAAPTSPGQPTCDATACRALREAEDVLAAVLLRERTGPAEANPAEDHAQG